MKKVAILFMVFMLMFAFGCYKHDDVAFDEMEPIALTQKDAESWVNREISTKTIFGDQKFDAIRLAGVNISEITLCVWKQDKFKFINYDYFSGHSFTESTLFDYDYFIEFYEIAEMSYAVCADKTANGLRIVIVDIYMNAEVAEVYSQKLPLTATSNGDIYLSIVEENEENLCNKIYRFGKSGLIYTDESYTYQINSNGKMRGKTVTAMGSVGNTLYKQVSTTRNELLHEGKLEIVVTDTSENITNVMAGKNPLQFVSGDAQFLFGSLYSAQEPIQNSGFCYDMEGKKLYSLQGIRSGGDISFLGKLGDEYLVGAPGQIIIVNMQNLTCEIIAKENMGDFSSCESGGRFAYVFGDDDNKTITIAQRNIVDFGDKIDEETRRNLEYKLNLPQIDVLYNTENQLYYLETSTYGNENNQSVTAIAWEYDKTTKKARNLKQFSYIFIDFEGVAFDDGILSIPHDMGKVTRINTLG